MIISFKSEIRLKRKRDHINMKSKLIVIEGACDGIGKSTQFALLKERLGDLGRKVVTHHFPSYNTPRAALVESYLKGELDGYRLEVTTISVRDGEESETEIEKYAYGPFDLKTATREFEMEITTDYDGDTVQNYETPDFNYYNRIVSSEYSEPYSYGSLEKREN